MQSLIKWNERKEEQTIHVLSVKDAYCKNERKSFETYRITTETYWNPLKTERNIHELNKKWKSIKGRSSRIQKINFGNFLYDWLVQKPVAETEYCQLLKSWIQSWIISFCHFIWTPVEVYMWNSVQRQFCPMGCYNYKFFLFVGMQAKMGCEKNVEILSKCA